MKKALIIGCGNMGTAILKSILNHNLLNEVYIVDKSFDSQDKIELKKKELNLLENNLNCNVKFFQQNLEILKLNEDYFDFILIAIKPQNCNKILFEYTKFKKAIFYSIMASKKIKYLEEILFKKVKIVRCMPNLCAGIKKSSSLICYKNLKKADIDFIEKITKSFGYFHKIKENLFEEMTIISGCVPAFFASFCDNLKNSLSSKIDQNIAIQILKESLAGTGETLLGNNKNFTQFISSVCSPGGLTQVGIDIFNKSFEKSTKLVRKRILKRAKELSVIS